MRNSELCYVLEKWNKNAKQLMWVAIHTYAGVRVGSLFASGESASMPSSHVHMGWRSGTTNDPMPVQADIFLRAERQQHESRSLPLDVSGEIRSRGIGISYRNPDLDSRFPSMRPLQSHNCCPCGVEVYMMESSLRFRRDCGDRNFIVFPYCIHWVLFQLWT